MKDPALGPRSQVLSAINTSFPLADLAAKVKAIAVLRKSNQKHGGA